MTIYIPRKVGIPLLVLLALATLGMLVKETPDLWRYAKMEGM
jgi:hypothetical protein